MKKLKTVIFSLLITIIPLRTWAYCSSMVICEPSKNKGNHLSICQSSDRKEIVSIHGAHSSIPSPRHEFHKEEKETITTQPALLTGDGGSVSFYNQHQDRPLFVTEEKRTIGHIEGLDTKYLKEKVTPGYFSGVGDFYLKLHHAETGKYEILIYMNCHIFSELPSEQN